MSDDLYAGDVAPREAWKILENDRAAILVDVRTDAEFSYVGVPDLSSLSKETSFVSWQMFPSMSVNPDFAEQVVSLGVTPETPILFLCRSGVRSRSAAQEMTARGYEKCYNVCEGFEGDPDTARHRGNVNGWKVAGLPWIQG
jgi:rhodanese-related sulfurtransferase